MRSSLNAVLRGLSSLGYEDFSDRSMLGPATYLLRKPGKMLRPALVFLGASVLGERCDNFVKLAMAAELLHTASLVHDDLIDEDLKRRGINAVHVKYGSNVAILAGDALIAKGMSLASEYGNDVMKAVTKSAMDMCAGELLDYNYQRRRELPDVREYLRIARLKSGVFAGTCSNIVPLYRRSRLVREMFRFGLNLGIAFQIRDDVMERVNQKDWKSNGKGTNSRNFKPDLISVIEKQFKVGRHDALLQTIELGNYFADRALGSIRDKGVQAELREYVDFVRVKKA
jgi:geranylgeranyl pyrophosphate synthase